MQTRLTVDILPQPDDVTCGPTCLHALYRYYGDEVSLDQVIAEVPQLDSGGTLAVLLGVHALKRGYRAKIYTYNLQIFDPSWFRTQGPELRDRLRHRLMAQMNVKDSPKLHTASKAYLEFLALGGQVRSHELSAPFICRFLGRGAPILTGLSSTYLYGEMREYGPLCDNDDIRGEPAGHFVVLCGYDAPAREVLIADPQELNPLAGANYYAVRVTRVLNAILLGILTYDANLLIIEPKGAAKDRGHAHPHRRQ